MKNFENAACKNKNQWYIKNPLRVECNEGWLIEITEAVRNKKWKIFDFELAKIKIGDILRNCCS